ncbi:CocE/NonD family hydrolase [Altericroceibacterium endophyticum]|uniref:CocE/NonD family hydrolase n=1 Tax=Altericroceibacterium endophyticum TaxID=1808508 RepID=A0A6I4T831_9SPHN|nr:CocE/NonD family hydrolase [Altericroceibacterium endophyticum]MXO66163.1 CocE/NonD family hydrolase [Altericroceibacterium endophyticum]
MAQSGFELIMRDGVDPSTAPGKPPLPPRDYNRRVEDGLLIERNVEVPMRDGIRILVDIYRPADNPEGDLPIILGWSPYGKHGLSASLWPPAGVEEGWMSRFTAFEAPDPAFWCAAGYAVVFADPRGAWLSEGDLRHNGIGEAEDCYDCIEWLAQLEWTNGKIGMTGVSYLAAVQYLVASLKPPHLAALNPWEGFSDWYREFAYHGGIRETGFVPRGSDNLRFSLNRTEDTNANVQAHPLYDDYWRSKEIDLEAIDIPAFVVASWSDQGLHTRGTIEAFRCMSSKQKWLHVHGQKKWAHYYMPESRAKQRAFFDHFLKGVDNDMPEWPRVSFQTCEGAKKCVTHAEEEWPLKRTEYRRLHLNTSDMSMVSDAVEGAGSISYDPCDERGETVFTHQFEEDTEITGYLSLRLWVEAADAEDMDLFVALQKRDERNEPVGFHFYAFYENGPMALGWLRVSHRELDEERSTKWRPVHKHMREQLLKPGEIVPVDIEIWPSSALFRAGESLRLVVKGMDIYRDALPNLPFARHEDLRNCGQHIIHAGGDYDSYLQIPVIPPRS